MSAIPVSSTSAEVAASTPALGGPFVSFAFTAIPQGGGEPILNTSPISTSTVKGLEPGAKYEVYVFATSAGGTATPPSAPASMTMPPPAAPTLTAAAAAGPTQGTASATAPTSGGPWGSFVFTATPVGGGSAVTVSSATPSATFNGLLPGTQYSVGVVVVGSGGSSSPPSNKLGLVTPSLM